MTKLTPIAAGGLRVLSKLGLAKFGLTIDNLQLFVEVLECGRTYYVKSHVGKGWAAVNHGRTFQSMMSRVSQKNEKQVKSGPKPPPSVIYAALLATLQSIAAIVFGVLLLVRDLSGAENESMVTSTSTASHVGTGTAIFIFIIFGFVIASSWAMIRGWRWGRGAIVLVQFILAASSFQMMTGGSVLLGIVTLISTLLTLFLIFMVKTSNEWFALNY
ncbi:MAG: hypothetical protein ACTH8I_08050 [Corynebacterium casei]